MQNALLQEASEEWEQCERKMKDVRGWMEKARQTLDSPQNKKKPLRDQHAIREKMLSDVAIQKTKITISVEKLEVHFRSGIGGDNRVKEAADDLIAELNALHSVVKEQTTSLEVCLAQIDQYQQVRMKILREAGGRGKKGTVSVALAGDRFRGPTPAISRSLERDCLVSVSGDSATQATHRAGGATAENGT